MSERFKDMGMVAHHKYTMKDKLIEANKILEEVKKAIDSRNFPDIQIMIEKIEFDKKMKSIALELNVSKKK